MPPEYGFNINDCVVYVDGKSIGKTTSTNFDVELEEKEIQESTYRFDRNKEINIQLGNVLFFPKKLGKYYYLKQHAKSWRIRKKNKKRYQEKLNELTNKLLRI